MQISKQRLVEEILNCQELYAKIEKYNNVESEKRPYGDSILHLDVQQIKNTIIVDVNADGFIRWIVKDEYDKYYVGDCWADWLYNHQQMYDAKEKYIETLTLERARLQGRLNAIDRVLNQEV